MKIICVDNFCRDSVSDFPVAENVHSHIGQRIVDLLNKEEGEQSPNFFKLVPDDHVLYKFEP
jgi:hypothetical protein